MPDLGSALAAASAATTSRPSTVPLQQCCIADCSGLSPMYESENYLFAGGVQSRAERDGVRSWWKDIRNDRNSCCRYRHHPCYSKRDREIRVRDRSGVDKRIGRTQSRLDCDRYVRDERDENRSGRRLRCDDKSGAVIEKDPARPGPSRIGSTALTSIVSRLLPPPRPLPARLYRPCHGCPPPFHFPPEGEAERRRRKKKKAERAYAEASAWQALTCRAAARAKTEHSTPNAEFRLCR